MHRLHTSAPAVPPILFVLLFAGSPLVAGDRLEPYDLQTEYLTSPLGIDEPAPRLSWKLRSSARGAAQSSYRILVASNLARLEEEKKGDLWDSGKVASDRTIGTAYGGQPLTSGQLVHWMVGVWDRDGRGPVWSEPARWSMGILESSEWKARWIGYDKPRIDGAAGTDFASARWIWFEGDPPLEAPPAKRFFRKEFSLPADVQVLGATLLITADDSYALTVNGTAAGQNDAGRSTWNRAGALQLGGMLRGGRNVLAVEVANASPGPAALIARLTVKTARGERVEIVTDKSWKSVGQTKEGWRDEAHDDASWRPARELAAWGSGPWKRDVASGGLVLPPPRIVRTEFTVEKPIRRAMLYAASLGLFDLRLNGNAVTEDYFPSGWTDYDRRVYYRSYDVTGEIRPGENALGAVLADGWYAGYVGFGHERDHYGKNPRLLAQLEIELADGSKKTVVTDGDWRAATGPTLEADFLMGESYDARLEIPHWDSPDFDDATWDPVDVTPRITAKIEAHPAPPVRQMGEIRPVKIAEPRPGQYVLDMGQNFAGVVRLRVRGEAGRKITLRFAEWLNPDGTVYTTNLRSARATDTYVLKGGEVEVWQPRFTFHGFQYVEVTGYPGKPGVDDIVGVPLSSATPVVGELRSSDPMVNQLSRNIYWTQRMNFIDIPTDCPQRDERLGWTGDAQVYIRTACMITDTHAFFIKWLVDLADAQRDDGQFPMIAPLKSRGPTADGGPAWADAGVVCPWNIYEVYGDKQVLSRHYEAMQRFISFSKSRCREGLRPPEEFHCFGDWLSIKADTPKDVIYLAYFAYSTRLLARVADVLGKNKDAERYESLYGDIKAAFQREFVAKDGRIKGNTQTCYVLALAFDLVDGAHREAAARYLIEDIEKRNWHLSTGFIGTKDLMLVLAKIGRNDVAYRLLKNTTFPSWGFSIRHGATTIWERWNGWTPENGFGDPGMNSFAHYSFGAVYQWMFENIGGIHTDGPAFKKILIRPQPGGGLERARVSYNSIRGPIRSEWQRKGGTFWLDVELPPNTSAVIHVPTSMVSSVAESGGRPADQDGVEFLREEAGAGVYRVGAGVYRFRSRVASASF